MNPASGIGHNQSEMPCPAWGRCRLIDSASGFVLHVARNRALAAWCSAVTVATTAAVWAFCAARRRLRLGGLVLCNTSLLFGALRELRVPWPLVLARHPLRLRAACGGLRLYTRCVGCQFRLLRGGRVACALASVSCCFLCSEIKRASSADCAASRAS